MQLSHASALGLTARVGERFSERLEIGVDAPIAVALSGGGDSMALLHLAAEWARDNGRRLLALTVDHGLNPDSASWTRFAAAAARAAGAEWRGLLWTGEKPSTGLPAAARTARHRLLADAAREGGARVILLAHTSDDCAEAEWMRRQGSTVGSPRAWAPSPVWPQGAGLMLFRPLLDETRADLRGWLTTRNLRWLEDPANADERFARSRARSALAKETLPASRIDRPRADAVIPFVDAAGVVRMSRSMSARILAVSLVCAGGGDRTPRGEHLSRLIARLRQGEDFVATLCGARLEARGCKVSVTRDPGEVRRLPGSSTLVPDGRNLIWDGRFAITADRSGWRVAPASGRQASLGRTDRAILKTFPVAARAAHPVFIRDGLDGAVLAAPGVKARALVGERLRLALDGARKECGIKAAAHGATDANPLS